jgi:alpha-glucosidase
MFVKKGSIIPMMPVMQYIHEQKEYPLYVHIFPDNIGETASFDLYEDNGEDLGYLKDVFSRTLFQCTATISNGYKIVITANDKGFKQADKRDMVLILNGIDNKPKIIEANQKKIRYVKNKEFDSIKNTFGWTWNEANKECRIKIMDTRINYSITIN